MDNKVMNYIILVVVFALAVLLYVKREDVMNYFRSSSAAPAQMAPDKSMSEEVDVEMEDADQD